MAGDSPRRIDLEYVECGAVDGRGRPLGVLVRLESEGEDALFLGEDSIARVSGFDGCGPDAAAVRCTDPRWDVLGIEVGAVGEDLVGSLLQGAGPVTPGQQHGRRGEIADGLQDIGSAPGGCGGREAVDDVGHGRRVARLAGPGRGGDRSEEPLVGPAERGRLVAPPAGQPSGVRAGLGGSSVRRCFAGERGAFPSCGIASLAGSEVVKLAGERSVHLGGALGEGRQQLLRHADDLGLPVLDRPPGDPIAVGQLGS